MYLLAIDIGTSGCKASFVDDMMNVVDSETINYATSFVKNGWAEQNAQDWWNGAVHAVRLLCARNAGIKIEGIGCSGHMLGMLPVDEHCLPLRPAMIHADTRAVQERMLLEKAFGAQKMYEKTGNVLSETSTLCKAMWLQKNEPETYAKAARFLQSKDYIVAKLTGNIDSTDFSDASHAMLIDIYSKKYLEDVFAEVGLHRQKFPALHRAIDIVGILQPGPAAELGLVPGIPVVAGGGDGACASVGAGAASPGDIYLSLGTTAWIAYTQQEPIVDNPPRVFNIMSLDAESYGVFGTTQAAGRVVSWVQELFGLPSPKDVDLLAAKAPAGSNGLLFLPYIEGERSPIFDAKAKGDYFGIGPVHKNGHFVRAALEGTAYALRDILSVMREKEEITELRILGGGAKSAFWKQIIADVAEVSLADITASAESGTSLGAAVAAGVGIGAFKDVASAAAKIGIRSRTSPNKENAEVHRQAFTRYKKLYKQLQPLFAEA